MKKLIFLIAAAVCGIAGAAGQVKKPTIMVVPSEIWCVRNGFYTEFDNQGVLQKIPDYRTALQTDPDIRLLISKMGGIMAGEDFELTSLEQEMRKLENEAIEMALLTGKETGAGIAETPVERLNRSAKTDILLDLDYQVKNQGAKRQVTFNLTALDAYTSKIISGNVGVSSLSSAPLETLLEESVLNFMDNFKVDLLNHFKTLFEKGREIRVTMVKFDSSPIDFEDEFEYNGQIAELAEIIGVWFEDNCVEGRFTTSYKNANVLRFDQVRMPLYGKSLSGREVALDTQGFTRGLVDFLRKEPYNLPVKVYPKGLGEIWLVVGEK